MKNKFKKGDRVIVNGIGKKENRIYINQQGNIIEKDVFFMDYNVKFTEENEDWFDEKALRKVRKYKERKLKNEVA